MRVAIDKNGDGIIDNIVEVESLELAAELFPLDTVMDAVAEGVQIGWVSDGNGGYLPPDPGPVEVVYKKLDTAALIDLIESAGGTTPDQVVACHKDPNMGYMWLLLSVTPYTSRDNPKLPYMLSALEAAGYLPNGAQAVLDAWPTE